MVNGDGDFALIRNNDKFFSRLLSKENSNSTSHESSFRYYYCGGSSGSIPFIWESQPGTPKHKLSNVSLPPLTPPPSYQTNAQLKSSQKQSKPSFLLSLFPKISFSSKRITSSPSVSSSSSFSISRNRQRPCSRSETSFDEYDHEEIMAPDSPTSTLCFSCGLGNSKRLSPFKKPI